MSSTDDPPLSMEELERIRGELRASIHKTEEMLARLEALLIAATLSKQIRAAAASNTFSGQPA